MYFDQKEFGQRLRMLRKDHGMTQEQLAAALHIGTDHYGRIELGKRGISIDLLLEIAEVLEISIDFLVTGKPQTAWKVKTLIWQMRELLDRLEAIESDQT